MTIPSSMHLSEDERQRIADRTLDDVDRTRVDEHLAACGDCAGDVARLTALMKRIGDSRVAPPPLAPHLDHLWPEIRRQIESGKVAALEHQAAVSRRRRSNPWIVGVAAAAAAITAVTVVQVVPPIVRSVATNAVAPATSDSILRFADDSIKSYQEEAYQLLDELKLERARLAPDTRASIDDDLKTVDLAIAELQAAIARDPNNATLRAMLASSYRQKVDVLRKISNAS